MSDFIDKFTASMADHGYDPGQVIADGKIHRFNLNGKRGDKSGWYLLYPDGPIHAGAFGDWKSREKVNWSSKSESSMSPDELKAFREKMEETKRQREAEREREQAAVSKKATEDVRKFRDATDDHPYLKAKRVKPFGLKVCGKELIVPFADGSGKVWTYQRIFPNGDKYFLEDGRKKGCFHAIKGKGDTVYLAEGYATAATIHQATGSSVICCADAGNILPVAKVIRELKPDARIVIAADDDKWTEGNPGLTKAKAAADAIGATVASPKFSDLSENPTDFNDLYINEGIEAVKRQVTAGNKNKSRFEFIHIGEVIKNIKPIEWRVAGILVDNCFTFSFGETGTYKTFRMLDIGLCIAAGIPYHGHQVKQGTVFYICGEGQQGIARRLVAWGIKNKIKISELPFFVSSTPTQLMEKDHVDDVVREVDRMVKSYGPPAMLCLDTLARNMGAGDESKSVDMNTVVSNLDAAFGNSLCRDINHHTGHTNKERERGSIILQQAVDSRFQVSLTADSQVLVKCLKQKDAPPCKPMLFNVEVIPLLIDDQADSSCVLNFIGEGDDVIPVETVDTCNLSGNMEKAVDVLAEMYSQYENNINAGGPKRTPRVRMIHWKEECLNRGIYSRGTSFDRSADSLEKRGLIKYDESKVFVYTVLIYRKYYANNEIDD